MKKQNRETDPEECDKIDEVIETVRIGERYDRGIHRENYISE